MIDNITPLPTETERADAQIAKLRGELAALETRRAQLKTEIATQWDSDTTALQMEAAGIGFKIEAGQQVLSKLESQRVQAVKTDTSTALRRAYATEQERSRAVEQAAARVMKVFGKLVTEMGAYWRELDAYQSAHGETRGIASNAEYSHILSQRETGDIAPEYEAYPDTTREFNDLERFCAQNLTIE